MNLIELSKLGVPFSVTLDVSADKVKGIICANEKSVVCVGTPEEVQESIMGLIAEVVVLSGKVKGMSSTIENLREEVKNPKTIDSKKSKAKIEPVKKEEVKADLFDAQLTEQKEAKPAIEEKKVVVVDDKKSAQPLVMAPIIAKPVESIKDNTDLQSNTAFDEPVHEIAKPDVKTEPVKPVVSKSMDDDEW